MDFLFSNPWWREAYPDQGTAISTLGNGFRAGNRSFTSNSYYIIAEIALRLSIGVSKNLSGSARHVYVYVPSVYGAISLQTKMFSR
jgi:hypothetical protein